MEYENIIVSCNHGETCGRAKKNKYDERCVSLLDDACEDHFNYANDGSRQTVDSYSKRHHHGGVFSCNKI